MPLRRKTLPLSAAATPSPRRRHAPGWILAGLLLVAAVLPGAANGQAPGGGSGLPLPRFVSLRADDANLRAGPGVQYPVEWVYKRKDIPLEVIAEFETWRKVRDWQGTQGWMHQSMLDSRRTVVVTGLTRALRTKMDSQSAPIAEVDPDAIGRVIECPDGTGWCKIAFGRYEGWLRRAEVWGVYPDEVVR